MPTNPKLDWMDAPVVLHIDGGEAAILQGLVSREWSAMLEHPDTRAYTERLYALKTKIMLASPKK